MSYRSFKRVIGETSLERKCRFLFGACLLVLITASFFLYGQQTEKLVDSQNEVRGRLLVDTSVALLHWEKFEKSDESKPWVRSLSESLQTNKYVSSFIRPSRVKEGKEQIDEFENDFLQQALANITQTTKPPGQGEVEDEPFETDRPVDGGRFYEYYQAVYAGNRCVDCHRVMTGPSDLFDGDLIAIAKIRISNEPTQKKLSLNRALLLSSAIITVFLAMVASWVIVRYVIVKPLKHLRDVSDEISQGDLAQRADIHTGDEFEALADALNRMLRHMVERQEQLQTSNTTLDNKVDELAQANMRLFELNRLKSDFLATMSHELRTPLNSILGFSEVLGGITSLDDKQKRYVNNIQKSGKMLLDMINDILDLAKIESGKMELRPTEFDLEKVVEAQCDAIRPLSEKKNIDLIVEVKPCDDPPYQDAAKLQQIITNLLSNAVKFTPEGGRIGVTARRTERDELELVVSDTGVGIAEEDQAAIFEKFRQGGTISTGGDTMTREFSGTGLGLSIVKELCKLLGGEITLESELGKGSEFTIHLPWRYRQPRKELSLTDSVGMFPPPPPPPNGEAGPTVAPEHSLGIGDP